MRLSPRGSEKGQRLDLFNAFVVLVNAVTRVQHMNEPIIFQPTLPYIAVPEFDDISFFCHF